MAKQAGPVYYTGTIGMVCFYKMQGKYYARLKSSLTGRRVKKDPAFHRTMENAHILGEASRIAAAVYRSVAASEKSQALYRRMTGIAMRMLQQKINPMKVLAALEVQFLSAVDPIETGTLCVNEEGVLQPIKVDWPPNED
ncbi:hypothetical protein [Chitinophaga cymbidii]|uniref:Uncharacterized protein n=1 Tax=Chitinophaga cymbidii TaxID=1096750 RepID=A0A512RGG8_9BACT|nr:hypothetical protein [Chitinophaga cymbidii]GEP94797.1 hypothetical protein CCY01nite_10570 [Chitinophaga cymbidii]